MALFHTACRERAKVITRKKLIQITRFRGSRSLQNHVAFPKLLLTSGDLRKGWQKLATQSRDKYIAKMKDTVANG